MTLDDHQGMLIPTMGEIVEEAARGGPVPLDATLDAVYNALTPEQQAELEEWLADGHEASAWNTGVQEE